MNRVTVVDSGVANLASVRTAFSSLGVEVEITDDPYAVQRSTRIVLPGVGSFRTAMSNLERKGLADAIRIAARDGTPILGICLGMQLLTEGSDEAPDVPGLGIIKARCERLPDSVTVPHLGWNRVSPEDTCELITAGDAAFANSYCVRTMPPGWTGAWTTHGTKFVSALERGTITACQFHPELSGSWGSSLLRRWIAGDTGPRSDNARAASGGGLARRIIPCLDVRDGRVVKGVKFQDLRDIGDPADLAAAYEHQGADEIVILDIIATATANPTRTETISNVREVLGIPLTAGGGVRSAIDAERLLSHGADKVSINTAAVKRPDVLTEMAEDFGRQCVVLAIDARRDGNRWEVLTVGGRESAGEDVVRWAEQGVDLGAGEILLTSWDRDGTQRGCDVDLIEAVSSVVNVPVIASGGIGSRSDVVNAFSAGADAVLIASILHDKDDTVAGVKQYVDAAGIRVRK